MSEGSVSNFIRALKAAFVYHWNLLYLGASAGIGIISGKPGIILPLAAAVEILYLSLLATNPRFQAVVAAMDRHGNRPHGKIGTSELPSADQILKALSHEDRAKFQRLQELCMQLRQLSNGLAEKEALAEDGINSIQTDNLNRLLWIYLKMLYSKTSLENFFRTINDKEIKAGLQSTRSRLQTLGPEGQGGEKEAKRRRSLRDMQQTLEARLTNYNNAKENYDFLQLEMERLYAKISGIVEMGINRQDAAAISAEIDVVSSSVMQTERTIQELESITGFSFVDEVPPILLKSRSPVRH